MTTAALARKLATLPAEPGVYLFIDAQARVIYVGKAANLRARVRSYFQPGSDDGRPLFRFIVRATVDLECLVCANELEALLLENNLIKKHRPRYNVRLRDDKAYLSLRMTTSEAWPRVQPVRGWKDDGNTYFGPYQSSQAVRELLRVIRKFIPLRTCANAVFESRKRPCIEYEIGRCTAPCVGLDTPEGYAALVQETLLFLRGKNQELLDQLTAAMNTAATAQQYERAARLRDQLAAVRGLFEKQRVQEVSLGDLDVFGYHRHHDFVSLQLLVAREGKLSPAALQSFRTPLEDGAILSSALTQFYQGARFVPPEVLLPFDFEDRALLERWLSERRGARVRLLVPERGDKRRLIEMANRNAEVNSADDVRRQQAAEELVRSLGEKLGLAEPPHRIECYDVSGIQGAFQVASRVVFEDGEPDPSLFRRYKIETVQGTDDFASLLEVLRRRCRAARGRDPLPDLIVVDGGKGQITAASRALADLGIEVPLIGLAKQRRKSDGRVTPERVFAPGRSDPLDLAQDSPESLYLQRIRDEAHRFANTYHRELRRKRNLITGLEEIPGVGPRRRRALLTHFGSLQALRAAPLEAIAAVPGMTRATAEATYRFLREGA